MEQRTPTKRGPRIDAEGRAFAGSQLQLQIYVNRRRAELDTAVTHALSLAGIAAAELDWRSPLERHGFRELQDSSFLRELGRDDLGEYLADFWPRSGPRWDGVAQIRDAAHDSLGAILVEAKSYPAEFLGPGCKAKPGSPSHKKILNALRETRRSLGVKDSDLWAGAFYQYANRLAHVGFLRRHGVQAFLVNVCFTGDPHEPTTGETWTTACGSLKRQLGLTNCAWSLDVLLPARSRDELLAPAI